MGALKDKPRVLVRKIFTIVLIGICCFTFGTIYSLSTKDPVLLWISVIIMLCCLYKGGDIVFMLMKNTYVVIIGECVIITHRWMHKSNRVTLEDENGAALTLDVPKSYRLKKDVVYRFYFRRMPIRNKTNGFIETAMTSNAFLGLEEV